MNYDNRIIIILYRAITKYKHDGVGIMIVLYNTTIEDNTRR